MVERGGPRDLVSVREALGRAAEFAEDFSHLEGSERLSEAAVKLRGHDELRDTIANTLADEVPIHARDGGLVRSGFRADLDELRNLRDESRSVIATLQSTYRDDSGISALKIKHNNVLGYFIETPATHADRMLSEPLSAMFSHRQTTASAVRFSTAELAMLETRIL